MKKTINYSICILLFAVVTTGVYAQATQTPGKPEEQDGPRRLTDQAISERLQKDWTTRNSTGSDQTINWQDAGYGYYGTYSKDNVDYMARYDKDGQYVETLTRKEWNQNIPSTLRTSFDKSKYKSHRVTRYWEVSDPNRKGYYLELKDENGSASRVWADDQGRFSRTPAANSDKNMYLVPDSTVTKAPQK